MKSPYHNNTIIIIVKHLHRKKKGINIQFLKRVSPDIKCSKCQENCLCISDTLFKKKKYVHPHIITECMMNKILHVRTFVNFICNKTWGKCYLEEVKMFFFRQWIWNMVRIMDRKPFETVSSLLMSSKWTNSIYCRLLPFFPLKTLKILINVRRCVVCMNIEYEWLHFFFEWL